MVGELARRHHGIAGDGIFSYRVFGAARHNKRPFHNEPQNAKDELATESVERNNKDLPDKNDMTDKNDETTGRRAAVGARSGVASRASSAIGRALRRCAASVAGCGEGQVGRSGCVRRLLSGAVTECLLWCESID